MDILIKLFRQLPELVLSFRNIGNKITMPLEDFLEQTPVLEGLVELGIFDAFLDSFPDISVFGFMFLNALGFYLIYTLIKWFLDIVL